MAESIQNRFIRSNHKYICVLLATSLKTKTYHSSFTLSDDVYDPDRDFVPLFDFSAPLTGFGEDFMDDDGEKTKMNLI